MSYTFNRPVRYTPDMEQPADDEAETIQAQTETLGGISQTTFENSRHTTRSATPRTMGWCARN
jgi:hypothetical protein